LPYRIGLTDMSLFGFAGIYEDWTSPDGSMMRTAAIITVGANKLLQQFHDRMPAILRPGEENTWLNNDQSDLSKLQSLLRPYPDQSMTMYRVSKRVNGTTYNDSELVKKFEQGDAEYQPPAKEKKLPAAKKLAEPVAPRKKAQSNVTQLNLFDLPQ